jgi:hypothetical protein
LSVYYTLGITISTLCSFHLAFKNYEASTLTGEETEAMTGWVAYVVNGTSRPSSKDCEMQRSHSSFLQYSISLENMLQMNRMVHVMLSPLHLLQMLAGSLFKTFHMACEMSIIIFKVHKIMFLSLLLIILIMFNDSHRKSHYYARKISTYLFSSPFSDIKPTYSLWLNNNKTSRVTLVYWIVCCIKNW